MRSFKFCGAAFYGFLVAIVCACILPANAEAAPTRALFVWNTTAIRTKPYAQSEFFAFLKAPFGAANNAITTLYFDGVRASDFTDPAVTAPLRKFLRAAHSNGLRVNYLCGDPSWARSEKRQSALDHVNALLSFNAAGAVSERYDGIAYDVEPYLLPAWPSPDLRASYLSLLEQTHAAISASGQNINLTAIIAWWYSNPELGGFDHQIIDRSDAIVIMDYTTTLTRLIADARAEIGYSSRIRKPVWVAVETTQLKETPAVTFYGRTNSQMEAILSQAAPSLMEHSAFAGYAIHAFPTYERMTP